MEIKLNLEQRKQIAASLQTVVLGQLAFFGYRGVQELRYGWIVASLCLGAILESGALFVLRVKE